MSESRKSGFFTSTATMLSRQPSSKPMDVCLDVSAVSPEFDCHGDQSVDESFVTNG